MNDKRILYLFTRTPLHVGAGASVGAIDQPIIRERHTGFPVIPATSLKGTFADGWNSRNSDGKLERNAEGKWLFGVGADSQAAAGALQFSEARLLAFPIRSAKGSFAWITSPLMLQRAVRDGVLQRSMIESLPEPQDDEAIFEAGAESRLALEGKVVLEEYTFSSRNWPAMSRLGETFAALLADEPVWQEVKVRLVILSNGMVSFFAQNACEVAQHVRINDETGTAEGGALFNQENVPSEAFFYCLLHAFDERAANETMGQPRNAREALNVFEQKVGGKVFQFGGDASTGLGYCTVQISDSNRS